MRLASALFSAACIGFFGVLAVSAGETAMEKDLYWTWGWGTYGQGSDLDVARYDWSLVNLGSIPADQRTVDYCNRVLALNPKHKFFVRVWPIIGLGDCKENRHQMTLFHYYYAPGVREKMLAETRRQVELIVQGVTKPENVAGFCFLEELPRHFTSCEKFLRWKAGDPLPWDIKRFEENIAEELKEKFDPANDRHRLWWGEKYAGLLADVHAVMKEASGGKKVMYYQSTSFANLTHLEPGQPISDTKRNIIPVRYEDILKPGLCDGIFGYPNNARIWEEETVAAVNKLGCPHFGQISTPEFMRLCHFDESVELGRWRNPNNLGFFIFTFSGRGKKAWNSMPYENGDSFWTQADHLRKFAWEKKIGLEVVEAALRPEINFDYALEGKKRGDFLHLFVQVYNPKHPSWYAGDETAAVLNDVRVQLKTPDGFSIPYQNNPGDTILLNPILPRDCGVADWWVYIDGDGAIPAGQAFEVSVTSRGRWLGTARADGRDVAIDALGVREIRRSGDSWIEPCYRLGKITPVVELKPLAEEISFPELTTGERRAVYRGTLRCEHKLVIGPGWRARLLANSLFPREVRTLAETPGGEFRDGYLVYQTKPVNVCPGGKYIITLTGKAGDGGNSQVIVSCTGKIKNKVETVNLNCLTNRFTDQPQTLREEITIPEFDKGTAKAKIIFYRFKQTGTVFYEAFDFKVAGLPEDGADVTDRLEGMLPDIERPCTRWIYKDLSDPVSEGTPPKLLLRFVNPEDAENGDVTERVGGDF
jgi:hypothetical protein